MTEYGKFPDSLFNILKRRHLFYLLGLVLGCKHSACVRVQRKGSGNKLVQLFCAWIVFSSVFTLLLIPAIHTSAFNPKALWNSTWQAHTSASTLLCSSFSYTSKNLLKFLLQWWCLPYSLWYLVTSLVNFFILLSF